MVVCDGLLGQRNMEEFKIAGAQEERASPSSWVVEMEKLLEATTPSVEMARWRQHSIYRVPEFIKKMTKRDAYQPHFVSLGPLHHGEPHLLPMEKHKRRAVLHVVKRSKKPLVEFMAAIEQVVDELQGAYEDLDEKWRGANKGRFVEMMVVDGCFLLELIGIGKQSDYAANDPIFSVHRFSRLWPILRNDMVAMENQLPLLVLHRLSSVSRGTSPSYRRINTLVLHLLGRHALEEGMDNLGLHILDLFHNSYCGSSIQWKGSNNDYDELRTPCAVELSEAGIQFKKSETDSIHDVDFQNGVLTMPLFMFDEDTEIIFLNLLAFEWVHPGAERDVASYIFFMDKLIESERDVALLRSKRVCENITGSDKKAVKLFNTLVSLTWSIKGTRLGQVQWKVSAHCRKRRNKWRASFVSTYMSNPWVFFSLLAAFVLLVATILQTVFTIAQFYTSKG